MSNFITLVLTTRDFFPDIHTYVMEYIKKDMIYMIRCVLDGIKVLSMYHENKFAIGNYFRGDFKNVIQVSWKEQLILDKKHPHMFANEQFIPISIFLENEKLFYAIHDIHTDSITTFPYESSDNIQLINMLHVPQLITKIVKIYEHQIRRLDTNNNNISTFKTALVNHSQFKDIMFLYAFSGDLWNLNFYRNMYI